MVDSLAFGVVLLVLTLWLASWATIGAVVAVSQDQEAVRGLVYGVTFGPVGVLFLVLNRRRSATRRIRVTGGASPSTSVVEKPPRSDRFA